MCVPSDGPATCPPCEQAAAPPVTLITKNHGIISVDRYWHLNVCELVNVKEWST